MTFSKILNFVNHGAHIEKNEKTNILDRKHDLGNLVEMGE